MFIKCVFCLQIFKINNHMTVSTTKKLSPDASPCSGCGWWWDWWLSSNFLVVLSMHVMWLFISAEQVIIHNHVPPLPANDEISENCYFPLLDGSHQVSNNNVRLTGITQGFFFPMHKTFQTFILCLTMHCKIGIFKKQMNWLAQLQGFNNSLVVQVTYI